MRYDLLNRSKYTVDKSCVFLSFPYFSIAKPQKLDAFNKADRVHPVRALFQTQDPLIDTTERDNTQSIKSLKLRNLKPYLGSSATTTPQKTGDPVDEIIHVPQMWALNVGSSKSS